MTRILVTGATGFIGSHLLPLLKEQDVTCLVRDPSKLPDWVDHITGDLMNPESYRDAVIDLQPQTVYHLAWQGLPDHSLEVCSANLEAGIAFFDVLKECNSPRVIAAGTCFEYGDVEGHISETSAPIAVCDYGLAKRALLSELMLSGLSFAWVRPFFVYGPGQRAGALLPTIHGPLFHCQEPEVRTPDVLLDWVHVDDVASAVVTLANRGIGGVFNVGSGEGRTVAQVVNLASAHFYGQPIFDDPKVTGGFWADISRIEGATDWSPRIPFAKGLEATLEALDRAKA